ncbi:MAG: Gfo/Idh/MocA family oxidoreductase [Erysipelotrichaceae bacterium]
MKFGIIGTNFVSEYFMAGAIQESRCEVVAVAGTSLEKANKFGDKYQIPTRLDDYKQLVGLVDCVYVGVPNALHKEVSMFFMNNKINVFCEKPMASNVQEVKEMIKCAKDNNVYLHEGLVPIYNPNFHIVKDNLPKVGKIHQVTLNFSKYSTRYDAYLQGLNPTTFRSELSNGAIMDLGVYPIGDCIGWFGEPKEVVARATLLETKADVSGSSLFVYDDFVATISYSKASDTQIKMEINGELGSIIIDHPTKPERCIYIDRLSKEETLLTQPVKESFYYEIAEMINCIEDGLNESKLMPLSLSLSIHNVITKCRKQAGVIFKAD